MSDDNETPQIEVNASPIPDQLWSGLRQMATAIIAFALGRHYIEGDTATMLGALGMGAFVVWGQIKTRHRATQLANIANDPRVPDAVAVAK